MAPVSETLLSKSLFGGRSHFSFDEEMETGRGLPTRCKSRLALRRILKDYATAEDVFLLGTVKNAVPLSATIGNSVEVSAVINN